jgi:hypothetical protein
MSGRFRSRLRRLTNLTLMHQHERVECNFFATHDDEPTACDVLVRREGPLGGNPLIAGLIDSPESTDGTTYWSSHVCLDTNWDFWCSIQMISHLQMTFWEFSQSWVFEASVTAVAQTRGFKIMRLNSLASCSDFDNQRT